MSSPVQLSVILNEQYTPLVAHEAAMSAMEARFVEVEEVIAATNNASIEQLETRVAKLEQQLAALQQSAAMTSDLEEMEARIATNEAGIAQVIARLASFTFQTGDVAALQAKGTLPERQLFIVVDTAENLEKLAADGTDDPATMTIVFGAPTPSSEV